MSRETTHRRALIFHGYGATPDDHWFGWLARQLEAEGIPTEVPALPHPFDPERTAWEREVTSVLGPPDEHTVVVAHSLGCLALLRSLRRLRGDWRLGSLVLVSGFLEVLPALPQLDSFVAGGCDTGGLADRVGRLVVLRSDDDPFVPPALTDQLAGRLGAAADVVPGAGHFLAADGVTSLPRALEAITGG